MAPVSASWSILRARLKAALVKTSPCMIPTSVASAIFQEKNGVASFSRSPIDRAAFNASRAGIRAKGTENTIR